MQITRKQQALLRAVRQQQVTKVRELLKDVALDPNFPPNGETTPLLEAVKKGNLLLVKALVEAGANLNGIARDRTLPLDLAEELYSSSSITRYLIKEGALHADEITEEELNTPSVRQPRRKKPASSRKSAATPFNDQADKESALPPKKPGPGFKAETLPEIFDAKKWVGKVDKMQQEWEKVPVRLKKKFDFAAALSEARHKTLQSRSPGKTVLKKNVPPQP